MFFLLMHFISFIVILTLISYAMLLLLLFLFLSYHQSYHILFPYGVGCCCTGAWVNVMKDPVTDTGKRSKTGRVTLFHDKATGSSFWIIYIPFWSISSPRTTIWYRISSFYPVLSVGLQSLIALFVFLHLLYCLCCTYCHFSVSKQAHTLVG